MSLLNVRRDVKDDFYRYKMERLQTKIEGKGNGIKTVIVNLSTVAQSLARPGSYLIKYFGFELGAQTNLDPPDDRWIINGAHEASKLQDHLDGFINKFVLCKKCKNPETDVVIKDGHIVLDCKACGQRSDVDLRLKLSTFVLKNQPKKGKKDKAERKAARRAKQQAQQNGSANGDDHGSAEDGSDNGSGSGDKAEVGSDDEFEKVQVAVQEVAEKSESKDDEWAVDMSEEAVKARMAQLPGEFKQQVSLRDDDDEDGEGGNSIFDQFGAWIQLQAAEKGGVDKVDSFDIYKKAKELEIESKHRSVIVLVQAIFDEKVVSQIQKRATLLKQFVPADSERHQKAMLGGTERLIGELGEKNAEVYAKIVPILQLYYNLDLVTEDVARKFATKASKKYVELAVSKKVRKAAEPFLKWLDEAEEESSDDE
jgi:translation initiation factor 5